MKIVTIIDVKNLSNFEIFSAYSFERTPDGMKKAEAMFRDLIEDWLQTEVSEEDFQGYLKNKKCEAGEGGIFIVWSNIHAPI